MKSVALIHTVKSVAKDFDSRLRESIKDIEVYNIWDDFIIKNVSKKDKFEEEDYVRLLKLLELGESSQADAILVTCSSLSIAIDQLKPFISIPVYKIDEAMLTRAVEMVNNITILATAESTIKPTIEQLNQIADSYKKKIYIDTFVIPKALKALKLGNKELHDTIICDEAAAIKNKELIILAQASMAHLEKDIEQICKCPVLSSPRLAIELLAKKLC